MVGLSIVLEGYNNNNNSIRKSSSSSSSCTSQVVNKSNMIKSSPTSPAPSSPNPFSRSYSLPSNRNLPSSNGFLDHCFLCRQKLLPGKDIYMYKGDRAFCSEECRYRQIFMDEEETIKAKRDNCSLAAIKPQHASSSPSSSRTTSSSRKGANKRANGFAY